MKSLSSLFVALLSVTIIIAASSCSKCKGEDPTARIINNGTSKASVQIKTSGGNTVNINNVDPGSSSPYSSYSSGEVTFTITVKSVDYVKTLLLSDCYDYEIAIDANDSITSKAVNRND